MSSVKTPNQILMEYNRILEQVQKMKDAANVLNDERAALTEIVKGVVGTYWIGVDASTFQSKLNMVLNGGSGSIAYHAQAMIAIANELQKAADAKKDLEFQQFKKASLLETTTSSRGGRGGSSAGYSGGFLGVNS